MIPLKANIGKLSHYHVPQNLDYLKLNQNESPFDIPVSLKQKICKRLQKKQWNRYPPAFPCTLIEKISAYTGFSESGILVANSSNELIQTLIYAACDSNNSMMVVRPTFSVYSRVAAIMNIGLKEIFLNNDFSYPVEQIIDQSDGIPLVILASPNNPTGTTLTIREIQKIAAGYEGLLVIDEAYFEFSRQSAQELIAKHTNIVILRTFSKAMSLAGIRLGYLLGDSCLVDLLNRVKLPFSVGFFQQVVGEEILANQHLIDENVATIIQQRAIVLAALKKLKGIQPVPSNTNFILFRCLKIPAASLYVSLLEKGILLRSFSTPELKDYLRVNVGTAAENSKFLQVLKELLKGV